VGKKSNNSGETLLFLDFESSRSYDFKTISDN
jgi:hypothetical protein